MRVWTGVVVGAIAIGGCWRDEPRIVRFDVQPRVACSGDLVVVTWDVVGEARLAIVEGTTTPSTAQLDSHAAGVPSRGTLTVPVAESTSFAILAAKPDAKTDSSDPEIADAFRASVAGATATKPELAPVFRLPPGAYYPLNEEVPVEVVRDTKLESTKTTTCDSQTQVCTGTFTMDATQPAQRVVRICGPTMTHAGHTTPTEICITHGGLVNTCITADHPFDTAVDAAGEWTLQVARSQSGSAADPPPELHLQLQLAGS